MGGFGDVEVVGWKKEDGVLWVVVCLRGRPACGGCGGGVWAKETREVVLADLPVFGVPVRLVVDGQDVVDSLVVA